MECNWKAGDVKPSGKAHGIFNSSCANQFIIIMNKNLQREGQVTLVTLVTGSKCDITIFGFVPDYIS